MGFPSFVVVNFLRRRASVRTADVSKQDSLYERSMRRRLTVSEVYDQWQTLNFRRHATPLLIDVVVAVRVVRPEGFMSSTRDGADEARKESEVEARTRRLRSEWNCGKMVLSFSVEVPGCCGTYMYVASSRSIGRGLQC